MTLKAAAGYPQYSGTGVMPPIFSNKMLVNFHQRTIFGEIANSDYLGELQSQGDTISFLKEPDFNIRTGTGKGGVIRHDTAQFDYYTMTVGRDMYFSLAVDPIDQRQVKNWSMLEGKLIESGGRKMAEHIDQTILSELPIFPASHNIGIAAGKITGSYNIGTPGAPIAMSSSNMLETLTFVRGIMAEQNIDIDQEDVFLVVPPVFTTKLMNSELKAAYFSGLGQTTYLNGRVPNKIAGLNIYSTNRAPMVYDAVAGKWCYHLLFGSKRAIAFINQIEYSRRVNNDSGTWLEFIQSRSVWDYGVIYPQLLGSMYVYFA